MSSSTLDVLPEKGVYTLTILMKKPTNIAVSRLGNFNFAKGYYAYTGSALNNLRKRVGRHMEKNKKKHWHIDFLLENDYVDLTSVIASRARQRMECEVNKALMAMIEASVPIFGFGASDCTHGCGSHLIYFGRRDPDMRILSAYKELFAQETARMLIQTFRN